MTHRRVLFLPASLSPREKILRSIVVDENGCWVWNGSMWSRGYGRFCANGKERPAHRVSYEVFCGPLDPNLEIDHLCRNRACVNPDHLEQVTSKVNNLRGIGIARINADKTHCVNGHEFTVENTRITYGNRICRACTANRTRERYYRMKKRLQESK
jgi:hypothetical protein